MQSHRREEFPESFEGLLGCFFRIIGFRYEFISDELMQAARIIVSEVGPQHVPLELLDAEAPERRPVVQQLSDYPARVWVPLPLHLNDANAAFLVQQEEIGATGRQIGLETDGDDVAHSEIRGRHKSGMAHQDLMKRGFGRHGVLFD